MVQGAARPAAAAASVKAAAAEPEVKGAALSRDSPVSPLDVTGDDVCFKTEAEPDRLQALL